MKNTLYITFMVFLISCSSNEIESKKHSIAIDGVSSLSSLMNKWANEFVERDSSYNFVVSDNGHEAGLSNLIKDEIDFFVTTNKLNNAELGDVQSVGLEIYEKVIAKDGLSLVVSNSSRIEYLTLDQIFSIFSGTIQNWSEVGYFDEPIKIFYGQHDANSNYFFREKMLMGNDITHDAIELPSTQAVVDSISNSYYSIGLVGITDAILSINDVKALSIVNDKDEPIPPTVFFVKYDGYPLSRSVYLYHTDRISQTESAFIDYCLSNDGQKKMLTAGVFPVPVK